MEVSNMNKKDIDLNKLEIIGDISDLDKNQLEFYNYDILLTQELYNMVALGLKLTTLDQRIIFIFINLLKWFRCQVRDSGFVQLNGLNR